MMKGVIYKVVNKETKEVYIGVTSDSIEERKKDHIRKANDKIGHKFQEAIGTYGPDAFIWEQIDTAQSSNELAEKERSYIVKFDSKEYGYNSDSGGGFNKLVYQYSINDGALLNTYEDLESASIAINATTKQISKACLGVQNSLNGFYWSYKLEEPYESKEDLRVKRVVQLDRHGEIRGEFNSVSEASVETGINKSSIAKVCRGERNQAGGFKWKFV